jgi:CRISPR-associated protein Cmr6
MQDEALPDLRRPLYRSDRRSAGPENWEPTAHAGLWYDKFCNVWEGTQSPGRSGCKIEAKRKLKWIKTVTRQPVGHAALLSEYATRRRSMIAALGGRCLDLVTESRFVTGLGREHPVENGFAWHSTLGTPYLPGSSVKGIVRAWAHQPEAGAASDWETIMGKLEQAGRVIFLDALPLEPVGLEPDVMTPHYADYYEGSNPDEHPPGDWLSPTPIPFLVVAPGAHFQFAVVPNTSGDACHLSSVEAWLREALAWMGGGAKTAVGYGRFVPDGNLAHKPAIAQPSPAVGGWPEPAKRPRYRARDRVTAKRVPDPKGKDRLWFQADDGFGGTLVGGKLDDLPANAIGQTLTLEIAAPLAEGYNFQLPREEPKGRSPKRPGKR